MRLFEPFFLCVCMREKPVPESRSFPLKDRGGGRGWIDLALWHTEGGGGGESVRGAGRISCGRMSQCESCEFFVGESKACV